MLPLIVKANLIVRYDMAYDYQHLIAAALLLTGKA